MYWMGVSCGKEGENQSSTTSETAQSAVGALFTGVGWEDDRPDFLLSNERQTRPAGSWRG